MLKITRPNDNTLQITIEGLIDSKESMDELMAAVIGQTDFTSVGTLKEHYKSVDGVKTDEVEGFFIDAQKRLPGMHAATYDGSQFWTKNANYKLSLFKIQDSPYATADAPTEAKAATISADSLKERLGALKGKVNTKPVAVNPAK